MTRSGRQKERLGDRTLPHGVDDDGSGTAARTRPFSYEDIMVRRRSKDSSQTTIPSEAEAVKELDSRRGTVEDDCVPHKPEFDSRYDERTSTPPGARQASEEFRRPGFRGKDSRSLREDSRARGKDRTAQEPDVLAEATPRDREQRAFVKKDALFKGDDYESQKVETKLKSRLSSVISYKDNREETHRKVHERSKHFDRARDVPEDKVAMGHLREPVVNERHAERSRGRPEGESKRRYQDSDDRNARDRNMSRKRDSRRSRDLEMSNRKDRREQKEQTEFRNKEVNAKRKRSRSIERGKGRRSASPSAKGHKRLSYDGRKHGESSSNSGKDRPERHHSDADRNRFSGNGLSSHYRGHGDSTSGLGGYSPRKRKTEKAVKTPSPAKRSPERKSAGWDIPPTVKNRFASSVLHSFQSSNQVASSNVHELASAVSVALSTMKPFPSASLNVPPAKNAASIDSVQLTESTRPMRRLYVENIPASSSEKEIIECLNNYLLSSGVNHIKGTQPCISCIIHKEKGQALVEFLTPEDASAALSFDGSSFSGSVLKIRRPKDFVEVTTGDIGETTRSDAAAYSLSDVVDDSPHKIFIGGISKVLSAEMLKEIASAFGPLKAFHFKVTDGSADRYAFLEYLDQSATLKACAGLNGMKLGGQVLTVTVAHAVQDPLAMGNSGIQSLYAIPDHAMPLLQKPTEVLKLKNVFILEDMSLSESEVEEVLEDVRLECARFGAIRSVHLVKHETGPSTDFETSVVNDNTAKGLGSNGTNRIETPEEFNDQEIEGVKAVEIPGDANELKGGDAQNENGNDANNDMLMDDVTGDDSAQMDLAESQVEFSEQNSQSSSENRKQSNIMDLQGSRDVDAVHVEEDLIDEESAPKERNGPKIETLDGPNENTSMDQDSVQNGGIEGQKCDFGDVFEPGCVLVEFKRTENSCIAAHCLHGRKFDERTIEVEYVPLDLYWKKFGRK